MQNAPVADRGKTIRTACGEIQVMKHHHDGNSELAVQLPHQLDHLELTADIQKGRRFIQQKHLRLLRQSHRNPCALALSAGKTHDFA